MTALIDTFLFSPCLRKVWGLPGRGDKWLVSAQKKKDHNIASLSWGEGTWRELGISDVARAHISGDYSVQMSQNEFALRTAYCASVAAVLALTVSGATAFVCAEHLDTPSGSSDHATSLTCISRSLDKVDGVPAAPDATFGTTKGASGERGSAKYGEAGRATHSYLFVGALGARMNVDTPKCNSIDIVVNIRIDTMLEKDVCN
jgi:hypothetical protein